jgi:serine/threonine protein kinase
MLKGKFGYMSPEQSLGQPVDARSDVFSLGILLYETTTGTRAFFGPNAFSIMNRVIACEYVPPGEIVAGYPADLAAIIARCLLPEPELRYRSVAELRGDVETFIATVDVADRQELGSFMRALFHDPPGPDLWSVDSSTERLRPAPTTRRIANRRLRATVLAASALGLGLVIGAGVSGRSPEVVENDTVAPATPVVIEAPEPEPEPEPAPEPEEEVVIVEDASADDEPSRGTNRRKRDRAGRRASRRHAAKASRAPSRPASTDLDGMFPTSMR